MVDEIVFLVTKIPCNSISKRQDQTLNVRVNYTYKGPARTGRLGAVVTQKTIFTEFDEIGSTRKEVYVNLPKAETPQSLATNIPNMPLSGCAPKSGYGIKVYALDLDGKPEWGCMNVLTITGVVVEYRLTLHASPSAGGTVSGGGTYPHMERVKITAYPKSGWYFDHWGGDFVSSDNPAYVYMSSDRDVTAYFYEEAVEEFTVTVRADPSYGGTVSKSPDKPKYEYGELIRLSCTPASGYYLNYWTRDGEWIESRTSFTTGVIRNHIFIAHFKKW